MILVNGMQSEAVPANDRGLAYGDGVFRTLLVQAGVADHAVPDAPLEVGPQPVRKGLDG